MKKKNLLTLGALCLSLGLVVSSCNQAGTEGPTGPTGPTGPQGEPGVPGTNGKTYKDVIVINDDNIEGGTVTQDVYFVTEGEHDSVTFTFTPENGKNIVTYFELNGEEVTVDPTATSYTLEDADTIKGSIQVTGAHFSSVSTYGAELLESYVKELNLSDLALTLVKPVTGADGVTTSKVLSEQELKNVKSNYYSLVANTTINEAIADAWDSVSEATSAALEDHKDDVKAQVEAIKTAETAAETAIKEAYNQALKDAKVEAQSLLEDLSEAVANSYDDYAEADVTNDKNTYSAKIEAATSFASLGNVINGAEPVDNKASGPEADLFYGAKQLAFKEVNDALTKVSSFATELDSTKNPNYNTLMAALASYGVETTTLPSTVAEEYLKQISAATDIKAIEDKEKDTWYTELGKEGAEAVTNSVDGIKETVLNAVKEQYTKEINDSKVLADQSATKTALLGVLETAISNYKTADKNSSTPFSITQYTETDITVGSENAAINVVESTKEIIDGAGLGLIGYVEYCLNQPVNGSTNQAWLAERIANAKASVGQELKTARDAIKDTKYDELSAYKKNSTSAITPEEERIGKGEISSTVRNPLFGYNNGTWSLASIHNDTTRKSLQVTVDGKAVNANFNLDDWLETLEKATIPTDYKSEGTADNLWVGGTLGVKSWVSDHTGDFRLIYETGLTSLTKNADNNDPSGRLNGKVNEALTKLTGGTYVTETTVSQQWTSLSTTVGSQTFADASKLINTADSIAENVDLLKDIDTKIVAWLDKKAETDINFKAYFGTPSETEHISATREAFEDELDAILAGEVSQAQLNTWTNDRNLDSIYNSDVAGYLEQAKDIVSRNYDTAKGQLLTDREYSEAAKLDKVYETITSFPGHKIKVDSTTGNYVVDDSKGTIDKYLCKTITSIDFWMDDAAASIAKHEVTVTDEVDTNVSTPFSVTSGEGESATTFINSANLVTKLDNGVISLSGDISDVTLKDSGSAIFPSSPETTPSFVIAINYDAEKTTKIRSTWLTKADDPTDGLNENGNSIGGWKVANLDNENGQHLYVCALLDQYKTNHVLKVEVYEGETPVATYVIDIAQLFTDSVSDGE